MPIPRTFSGKECVKHLEESIAMGIQTLKDIPLFKDLNETEIHKVFSLARMVEIPSLKVLFSQGSPGCSFYIIKSGEIALKFDSQISNRHFIVDIISTGDYFGEMSLIDDQPRSLTAEAISDTVLIEISKKSFDHLLNNEPAIAAKFYRNFSRILAERLRARTSDLVRFQMWKP